MDTLARLDELLDETGMSSYRLSHLCGFSPSTISSARKRNGQLSVDVIERICLILKITLAQFFADEDESEDLLAGAKTRRINAAKNRVEFGKDRV